MKTMSIKDELTSALKVAMREGDDACKSNLRLVLSAIKLAEVEKRDELDDPTILGIIQKEVKARHETIRDAKRAGRPDLIRTAEADISILNEYLPQPLSEDELENLVRKVIAEQGASTPRDMGMVMKALMPRIQGRADGGQASALVRKILLQK
jgi:uncharacterized protein YqeY